MFKLILQVFSDITSCFSIKTVHCALQKREKLNILYINRFKYITEGTKTMHPKCPMMPERYIFAYQTPRLLLAAPLFLASLPNVKF